MKLIIFIYFSFYIFSALVNIDYISKIFTEIEEDYKTNKTFSMILAFLIFWLFLCIPISLMIIFIWFVNLKNKIKFWFKVRKNANRFKV